MAADTDIQIDDLTSAEVEGRGVFDELMRAVKDNIVTEHEKGRITGADYGKVYLGSMQTVLSEAAQFVLQKGVQSKQVELLQKQIEKVEQDTLLVIKQQEQLDAQIALVTVQTALAEQQLLTEVQNTRLVTNQADNALAQNDVIVEQANKLRKDIEAVQEQIYNSQAQRVDTVNGVVVNGVLGKQKELYQAQIDGFDRDAEQKLTKILLDTWAVSRTTNDAVEIPSKAANSEIDDVISKARVGIGLST